MAPFSFAKQSMRYEAPESLHKALALLAAEQGDVRMLLGGTDLLVQLRAGLIEPSLLIDLKRIAELRKIEVGEDGFEVGAAVSAAEVGEHAQLRSEWPGVVEAVELIGSTQIQARATMVGNLCNASPAADTIPAMIAAGASVIVAGPGGSRILAVEDVCTGPGTTTLARQEVVTALRLPRRASGTGDAYLRFIPRTEMDIAVVGAGVCVSLDDAGICRHARVSLGAVAARPLLVDEAARCIIGSRPGDDDLQRLGSAASAACDPIDDKRGTREFRTEVAGVLARRAAGTALDRAKASL